MIKYLLILIAAAAGAVTPDQILMEEPARTNRSAMAWIDAMDPYETDVAQSNVLQSLCYQMAFDNGMTIVPGVLEASTERFSTNWSYGFKDGGGIGADCIDVRHDLTSGANPLVVSNLVTRFLAVTNRGAYGYMDINSATIQSSRTNLTGVSTIGSFKAGVLKAPSVEATDGTLDIVAPSVYFEKEPVFPVAGGIFSSTNYPPMATFRSCGYFNVGKYADGLMWMSRTNTGWSTANVLQSIGMEETYPNITYPMSGGRQPADWSCVPVLTTYRSNDDYAYTMGWWEYDQHDMAEAYISMTNAVTDMFAHTNNVAGFTTAASMIQMGASPAVSRDVFAWAQGDSVTGVLETATDTYLDSILVQINAAKEAGTVCVSDGHTDDYVAYHRYQHMQVATDALIRVSVSLQFTNSAALSATPARYWLTAEGNKLLTRRVSSAGDFGPAFTVTSPDSPAKGYLYLDLSEVAEIHSNALKSAWYYVKFEELKGFTTWPD